MEDNFSINKFWENTKDVTETDIQDITSHKLSSILVSNFQYIEWLKAFCTYRPYFCDDDWDFYPIQITMKEYENVKRLRVFYQGIVEYAKAKKIPLEDDVVFLKFDQVGFEIGPSSSNKYHAYYCRRKDISSTHDFIDFDDIMYHVAH